jgi:hypothetical protein
MAAITHRGITYTLSAGTPTMNLDLQLQGGVDQDETLWLDGQATAGYPGNLDGFQATNTQVAARHNPRMVMLTLAADVTEGATLTLTGECSKIISCVAQRADATANVAIVKTSDLVLTFDMEATADGTTDDLTQMELWLMVV